MKVCTKCGLEKDSSEFYTRSGGTKLKPECKMCTSEWHKQHKKNNPEWFKEYHLNRRNELREWVAEMKSNPCVDCERSYPWYVMQYDHRGKVPKRMDISKMCGTGMSKKSILEEIEKCDLVCANCHAVRTYLQNHREAVNV